MGDEWSAWWRGLSLSGGLGAFRGVIPPSRIASLVDATGLPSTTRRLTCVGEATPIPAWEVPGGAVSETCLDGTAPEEFSSAQPTVQVGKFAEHRDRRRGGQQIR